MPIRFERRQKIARYLDPRIDFQERTIACEMRRDPLTGCSGRVAHGLGFHLHPLDVAPLVAASQPSCPFCPDQLFQVTPRFPAEIVPEGRLQLGEAVLFPNLVPYDEHSAVTVMSQQHYVPLGKFTQTQLFQAFRVSQDYLRYAQQHPRTTYALVFWNYFPASGGTQIHPHLQVFATDAPGNTLEEELTCSSRYYREEGRSDWGRFACGGRTPRGAMGGTRDTHGLANQLCLPESLGRYAHPVSRASNARRSFPRSIG